MAPTDLTPNEAAIVGLPGDLVDEERVPARPKSSTVMFSLRVDRQTFEALSDIAEERGRRFSDVARDALHEYVDQPTNVASYRLLEAIAVRVGVKTAETEAPYSTDASEAPKTGRKRRREATTPAAPEFDAGLERGRRALAGAGAFESADVITGDREERDARDRRRR